MFELQPSETRTIQLNPSVPSPKTLSLREIDIQADLTSGVINKVAYIRYQLLLRYGGGETNIDLDEFAGAISFKETQEDGRKKRIKFEPEDVAIAIAQLAKKGVLANRQTAVQLNIYSV